MRRFMLNRWWTCILALVLGVAGVLSLPRTSLADDSDGRGLGDNGGGTLPGTNPDPQGAGDPDSPSSSGKSATYVGGGTVSKGRIGPLGYAGVGDARVTGTARMWLRVRFALGMFKYYYLRF
jgi:hypothetical protein